MTISNKYKNTLEDLIDSSNIEPSNILRLVYKNLRNVMSSFEDPPIESELDKNILAKS